MTVWPLSNLTAIELSQYSFHDLRGTLTGALCVKRAERVEPKILNSIAVFPLQEQALDAPSG